MMRNVTNLQEAQGFMQSAETALGDVGDGVETAAVHVAMAQVSVLMDISASLEEIASKL